MTSGTHSPRLASRLLPASLEYAELQIHSTAKLSGTDIDDPGLTRVNGTVSIIDVPGEEDEPLTGIEGIGLRITPRPDGTTQITILQADAIVLDLDRIEDPYESLDADSQELEAYGCLFDLATGELHPDLEGLLGVPLGSHVVIAERVRVAPAWRGYGGVGRYLAGRLFLHMCCDPVVVATQPFPLDIDRDEHGRADDAALKPALRQIQRTWKSIGFRRYKGEIWILDPTSNVHERAMTKLARQLGPADSRC
jgi:hypothetical protein